MRRFHGTHGSLGASSTRGSIPRLERAIRAAAVLPADGIGVDRATQLAQAFEVRSGRAVGWTAGERFGRENFIGRRAVHGPGLLSDGHLAIAHGDVDIAGAADD